MADEFADDLQLLLTLGEGQLKILLDQMLSVAKGELETDDMEKGIAPQIGLSEEDTTSANRVLRAVVLRILSGKSTIEIQDDLVAEVKVPKDKIRILFSLLERLSQIEKSKLRGWTLFQQIRDFNPHWSSIRWDVQLRQVIDNGHIVGSMPYLTLQILVSAPESNSEKLWILEMAPDEFKRLSEAFRVADEDYRGAIKEFKSRMGELVAAPQDQ